MQWFALRVSRQREAVAGNKIEEFLEVIYLLHNEEKVRVTYGLIHELLFTKENIFDIYMIKNIIKLNPDLNVLDNSPIIEKLNLKTKNQLLKLLEILRMRVKKIEYMKIT